MPKYETLLATYLLGVIADLADDNRRKLNLGVADLVGANVTLLSLDTELAQLLQEEIGHVLDILDVSIIREVVTW